MNGLSLKFYTVPEIADIVQLTPARVYEAVRLKILPAVHIGRQIRIEEKAFLDWVGHGGRAFEGGWRREAS